MCETMGAAGGDGQHGARAADTEFQPRGSAKTCSEPCSAQYDRAARAARNRTYHQTVRKAGLVKTNADWAADKRDSLAAKARERRRADPEHVRQVNRASRARHAEAARARAAAWKAQNPDRVKVHRRADYVRNKARFRANDELRKLRIRSAGMSPHDLQRHMALLERYGDACAYCAGSVAGRRNRHIDHVIPIALGGPDTLENTVVACAKCNRNKWHRPPLEWLRETGLEDGFRTRFSEAYERLLVWESERVAPFPPSPWLTLQQAALFFRCSVRTLRRRVGARTIEFEAFGSGPNAKIHLHVDYVRRATRREAAWSDDLRAWVPQADS